MPKYSSSILVKTMEYHCHQLQGLKISQTMFSILLTRSSSKQISYKKHKLSTSSNSLVNCTQFISNYYFFNLSRFTGGKSSVNVLQPRVFLPSKASKLTTLINISLKDLIALEPYGNKVRSATHTHFTHFNPTLLYSTHLTCLPTHTGPTVLFPC